mmetsp:Transcript_85113/g.214583  ORF Transcript_85113/g.214583 Transcript_85113/m.214583 type:complete len:396 (-) Transcript_85113:203-1390(-)
MPVFQLFLDGQLLVVHRALHRRLTEHSRHDVEDCKESEHDVDEKKDHPNHPHVLERLEDVIPAHSIGHGLEQCEHRTRKAAPILVVEFRCATNDRHVVSDSLSEQYAKHVENDEHQDHCPHKGPQRTHDRVNQCAKGSDEANYADNSKDPHQPGDPQQADDAHAARVRTTRVASLVLAREVDDVKHHFEQRAEHNQHVKTIPEPSFTAEVLPPAHCYTKQQLHKEGESIDPLDDGEPKGGLIPDGRDGSSEVDLQTDAQRVAQDDTCPEHLKGHAPYKTVQLLLPLGPWRVCFALTEKLSGGFSARQFFAPLFLCLGIPCLHPVFLAVLPLQILPHILRIVGGVTLRVRILCTNLRVLGWLRRLESRSDLKQSRSHSVHLHFLLRPKRLEQSPLT